MQTLDELYEEILSTPDRWSYYDNPDIDTKDIWKDEDRANEFIKKYFKIGLKENILNLDFWDYNKEQIFKSKAPHIVSTFLLGIKIAESFGIDIQYRNDENMNFLYCWFLTCLYHDIGYVIEKNENTNEYENWLMEISNNGINAVGDRFCNKNISDNIFRTYSKEIVETYLIGRATSLEEEKGIDHGIVGGLLLYDKLIKNFYEYSKKNSHHGTVKKSFSETNPISGQMLVFSEEHFEYYAKAADAVISHNIWKDTLKRYLECKNISYCPKDIGIDNELCFVLCIADTIEPIKRNLECSNLMRIEELKNRKGITIQFPKGIHINSNENISDAIKNSISSLGKWIEIKHLLYENEKFYYYKLYLD